MTTGVALCRHYLCRRGTWPQFGCTLSWIQRLLPLYGDGSEGDPQRHFSRRLRSTRPWMAGAHSACKPGSCHTRGALAYASLPLPEGLEQRNAVAGYDGRRFAYNGSNYLL